MSTKTITAPAPESKPSTAITSKPSTAAPTNGPPNPFQKQADQRTHAGVVAIESERAIAEAQGKLVLAKRFPRDPFAAFEMMRAACMRPGLAEEAFYEYPRGGKQVRGASIRLAEELARCWGNMEYGQKELSNDAENHVTEMLAFAWDLETNVMSTQQFTVRHIRDRSDGGKELTEQRDIYEIGANYGARRMRSRMLAVMPADFVDAAVQFCTETLRKKDADTPLAVRAAKLIGHFATFGVTIKHLEDFLGHSMASITDDDFVKLRGVANALKDGAKPAEYFSAPQAPSATPEQPAPGAQPAPAPAAQTAPAAPAAAPSSAPSSTPAPAAKAETKPAETKPDGKPKRERKSNIVDVGADGQPLPKADASKPAETPAPAAPAAAAAPATEPAPTTAPAAEPSAAVVEADDDIFS